MNLSNDPFFSNLDYNPETGIISRLRGHDGAGAGPITTKVNSYGYRRVMVNRKDFMQHRLIFILMGKHLKSKDRVDHINGIRDDNRWVNLRIVTDRGNSLNLKRHREGKMPYVTKDSRSNSWALRKTIDGKLHVFGRFKSQNEAIDYGYRIGIYDEYEKLHNK